MSRIGQGSGLTAPTSFKSGLRRPTGSQPSAAQPSSQQMGSAAAAKE